MSSHQATLVVCLVALLLDAAASPSLLHQCSLGAAGESHASSYDYHHHRETPKEHANAAHHHHASPSADIHDKHGKALVLLLRHSDGPGLNHLLHLCHDCVPDLLLLLHHNHMPGLVVVVSGHLEKEDEEDLLLLLLLLLNCHEEEEGDKQVATHNQGNEGPHNHGNEEAHKHGNEGTHDLTEGEEHD